MQVNIRIRNKCLDFRIVSLTVANLLILLCRVTLIERKLLKVAEDSEGRIWEFRKLARCKENVEVWSKKCTFVSL